jgi:hypothetical protein
MTIPLPTGRIRMTPFSNDMSCNSVRFALGELALTRRSGRLPVF